MKLKKVYFAAAAILVSAAAYAYPASTWTMTYYTDSTYTTEAGTRTFTCQGRWIQSGEKTAYGVITDEQACDW